MRQTCPVCGSSLSGRARQLQADSPYPNWCIDCLEETPENPQYQSLMDGIESALNPANAAVFTSDKSTEFDRVHFALRCIEKGHIEGGSPGFIINLRRYAIYLSQLDETDEQPV